VAVWNVLRFPGPLSASGPDRGSDRKPGLRPGPQSGLPDSGPPLLRNNHPRSPHLLGLDGSHGLGQKHSFTPTPE